MPLVKVKKNEKKKDFLDRCLADENMNKEFDDEKQRYAVCNQIWKDSKKKKSLRKYKESKMKKEYRHPDY